MPVDAGRAHRPSRAAVRGVVGLLLLVLVVSLVLHAGDEARFLRLLARVRPGWLALGAAFQLGTYLAVAAFLQTAARRAGVRPSLGSLAQLAVARLFTDDVVPTGGVGGMLLTERGLERRGVPRPIATATVLLQLFTMFAAQVSMAGVGLALAAGSHEVPPALPWLAGAGVALGAGLLGVIVVLRRRGPPRVAGRVRAVASFLDAIARADNRVLRDTGLVGVAFAAQLGIVLCDAATMWALFAAVGEPEPPGVALASLAFGDVAASLGLVPGGLGTFEGAATATATGLGVDLEVALAVVLLTRGLTNWLPSLLGAWYARRELLALDDPRQGS